jgi:hypothetical protein
VPINLTIDVNNYPGDWVIGGMTRKTGNQQVSLLPGAYEFRIIGASDPLFHFTVNADGSVSTTDTDVVTIIGNTVAVRTYLISIDAGNYVGDWVIGGLTRKTGNQQISLVPSTYEFSLIGASTPLFQFALDSDGSVSSADTDTVIISGSSVAVKTHPILVDVGSYGGQWTVRFLFQRFSESQQISLPPGVYQFGVYEGGIQWPFEFSVDVSGSPICSTAYAVCSDKTIALSGGWP